MEYSEHVGRYRQLVFRIGLKRNKAKRMMRELAKKVLIKYGKINSYYVLIAKNSMFSTPFATLEIELKKLITC